MAKKKKIKAKEQVDALLKKARKRLTDGQTYWSPNWLEASDDLTFLSGKQWDPQAKTDREAESRPCLTNNVLPTFVDQVLGEQRQNRPSIKINSTDMQRTEDNESLKIPNIAGKNTYELAEVLTGLIKNIEYSCDAETSYDIAFQAAVESGFGFLRVLTEYQKDSFYQDIIISHVSNQFSVVMDPSAKKRDKSDMNWCFIHEKMPRDKFEELYPDATADDAIGGDYGQGEVSNWYSEGEVTVTEYFTREPIKIEMAMLSDQRIVEYDDDFQKIEDELADKGTTVVAKRKVDSFKVVWRKITGHSVLEGPIEFPTTTIPIVPVWGKALTIKDYTTFRGLIRFSKDSQRMANYWDSAATESIALAPKAPFVGTAEQIEGYEDIWETANTKNHSILTYNQAGPGDRGPQRQQPAIPPTAEMAMGQNSVEKIKGTMGMHEAQLGQQGKEVSGKAILARQQQGGTANFAFTDNLSKSIRRIAKLLVEMIPTIYDTERVVRIMHADDTDDFVMLNEKIQDEQTGEWVTINDLGVGKYDVVVTTGPAFATQRQEAAETMIQFAQAVPQAAEVMADLIALNMDWPGADAIAARLRKIIPPNVLTQDEREKDSKDMPEPPPPSPEQQAAAATAQADIAKAESEAEIAKINIIKAQLETEAAKVNLEKITREADAGNKAAAEVKGYVAQALAEIMSSNAA